MIAGGLQYAVVTPVKDEQNNLERVAASLDSQTVAPLAWVIVDTGSTDDTVAIAERWPSGSRSRACMSIDESAVPTRGGPVVRGFVTGLESLDVVPDVVIKLDADLSFEPDYCQRLLEAFTADPRLGLTSGICTEASREGIWDAAVWHPLKRVGSLEGIPMVLPSRGAAARGAQGLGRDRRDSRDSRLERPNPDGLAFPTPPPRGFP